MFHHWEAGRRTHWSLQAYRRKPTRNRLLPHNSLWMWFPLGWSLRAEGNEGPGKFYVIEYLLQGVFYHFRNNFGQQRAWQFQAGIRVDLDQVDLHEVIDHEIEAIDLEICPTVWVKARSTRADHICSNFLCKMSCYLHSRVGLLPEAPFWVLTRQVSVKLFIRNLISFFILPILWQILLNGVIGQMDASQTLL